MLSEAKHLAFRITRAARFFGRSTPSELNEGKSNELRKKRLEESKRRNAPWKKWGPYLTERQWGTVREDYSPYGNAWEYVSHDAARSKAYRWGEDGIAGVSDDAQLLCLGLALWNGRDPILKERIFGLTGNEGNKVMFGNANREYFEAGVKDLAQCKAQ